MKKYFIWISLFQLILISCLDISIYEDVEPQLEIIVKNEAEQPVSGATVDLFLKKDDWQKNINSIYTGNTDNQGRVVFTDLQEFTYYFYVLKNNKDNRNQISTLEKPLKKNVKAIVETIIK